MMIKKFLYILFLVVSIVNVYACKCKRVPLAENYRTAEVVGVIRILKVYDEDLKQRTYKADVKFEKIYKGKKFKTLTVKGLIGNSDAGACEINVEPNETYLILLNEYKGSYPISSCSPKYSLDIKEKSTLNTLEKAFAYIDKNKYKFLGLKFTTCYDESRTGDKSELSNIKNFSPKNPFAIYKIKINDLSKVEELTPITTFGDHDQEIENILKKNMTIDIPIFINEKPKKEFLILLLYSKDNLNKKYREVVISEW